jgi:hypothetical protein
MVIQPQRDTDMLQHDAHESILPCIAETCA